MSFFANSLNGKRAILYTRVSTDEQAERGYSLPVQEEQLRKWCERHGVIVVALFREEGASAKTFDRHEFNKVLDLVKKNKNIADLFLVLKWDRFSRNAQEAYAMISYFEKIKIVVNAIEQWIDFTIPEQDYMLSFYLTHAHVSNKIHSNRVSQGMRRAKKEGNWISTAPKGYTLVPDGIGKSKMVPGPDACFVQEAFQRIADGVLHIDHVRQDLIKKGWVCSKSRFLCLLRNTVYISKIRVKAFKNEPEEVVECKHQPLISEEVFYKVQDALSGTRKTRVAKHYDNELFILRGFLECNVCGKKMTSSFSKSASGARYPYYHCVKDCKTRFRAENVNSIFVAFLKSFVFPVEVLDLYSEVLRDVFSQSDSGREEKVKTILEQIETVESKLLKIELKYAEDEIEKDSFTRVKAVYQKELTDLKIKKIEAQSTKGNYEHYLSYGMSLLSKLDFYYDNASVEGKRAIISSIFGENIVFDGERYRTFFVNEVVSRLSRFGEDLREGKNEKSDAKTSLVSYGAPENLLFEHLKRVYSLHRYIRLVG